MFQIVRETWVVAGKRVQDYTLYTGSLGTAFLLLKAYQITSNEDDLTLCSEIVKACDSASSTSGYVSFLPLFPFAGSVMVAMIGGYLPMEWSRGISIGGRN